MMFVAAELDEDECTAVTTVTTDDTAERRWLPSEWPELAAQVGNNKIITWGGGKWLEKVIPEHSLSQIDLFALFVGQHRHPVGLYKFMCVTDGLTPVMALRRIAMVAAEDGRLLWRQNNGRARAWYTQSFDVALEDVVERRAADWQTSPLDVVRPIAE